MASKAYVTKHTLMFVIHRVHSGVGRQLWWVLKVREMWKSIHVYGQSSSHSQPFDGTAVLRARWYIHVAERGMLASGGK